MRGIIINPWLQTVFSIEEPDFDLDTMYRVLSGPPDQHQCNDINAVQLGARQILWVDGEGFLYPNLPTWKIGNYPSPLAGMGLILGNDGAGDNISTFLEPEQIEKIIVWSNKVSSGYLAPTETGPGYVKIGAPLLKEKD